MCTKLQPVDLLKFHKTYRLAVQIDFLKPPNTKTFYYDAQSQRRDVCSSSICHTNEDYKEYSNIANLYETERSKV
ncbi:predicted protein [Botrytis cinerea T4]|uniref:Uncharacterized protein n=1 Tax=Botryotinia fuckeliana (strain T4) TaxID=999810 RepID=G2YDD8_BOTF4|nr:predicted protein [Botrytis cinerea T4]